MRHMLKLINLVRAVLLIVFSVGLLDIVDAVNSTTVINWRKLSDAHQVHVKSLNLWTWVNDYEVKIKRLEAFDIVNWISVWTGIKIKEWALVVIGWWVGNQVTVKWNYVWIAWWQQNTIENNVESSVIGGGYHNRVLKSQSVIWGGYRNTVDIAWWTILGWKRNTAQNIGSVVLGWETNAAGWKDSFAVGKSAKAWLASFSWHDGSRNMSAVNKTATIWATSGILIGTYDRLAWVNLVVSGAVKISWTSSMSWTAWEIKMLSGCFYAYDGTSWHVFGKNSNADSNCKKDFVGVTCTFGNVVLQQWDIVTAYSQPYSKNCNYIKKTDVTCTRETIWWVLTWVLKSGTDKKYIYPSCYTVSATPTL